MTTRLRRLPALATLIHQGHLGHRQPRAPQLHIGLHHRILVQQVVLLRPQYAPRPRDPDPSHRLLGREPIVLHHIAANQHPRSPQPSLAVHGQRPLSFKLRLGNLQKPLKNPVRRTRPVRKVQIVVRNPVVQKPLPVVHVLVQPHHARDPVLLEVPHVVLRRERAPPTKALALSVGPRKCQELARNDPVQVPVLHLLVMLVRICVKRLSLVPVDEPDLLGPGHAHQHLLHPEGVHRRPIGRVTEPTERLQVTNHLVRTRRRHVHIEHHEDTRQRRHIGPLMRMRPGHQVGHLVLLLRPRDEMVHPLTEPPRLRQTTGPKVRAKRLIDDIVIAMIVQRPVGYRRRRHLRGLGVVQVEEPRDNLCVAVHLVLSTCGDVWGGV